MSKNDSYLLDVYRLDDGLAIFQLQKWDNKQKKYEAVVTSKGGWDDAIPWSAGNYTSSLMTKNHWKYDKDKTPVWELHGSFPYRENIEMHIWNSTHPSWSSFGCLVTTSKFLKSVHKEIGDANLAIKVEGFDANLHLALDASPISVKEGDDFKLTVHLNGDDTGVSKDCWVLVKQVNIDNQANATYGETDDFWFDYSDASSIRSLKGMHNDADRKHVTTITDDRLWVKIPAGQTSATITVHTNVDAGDSAQIEYARFQISDYLFYSPNSKQPNRFYSDYLGTYNNGPGKILLQGGNPYTTVQINGQPLPNLTDLAFTITGKDDLSNAYYGNRGDRYHWIFTDFNFQCDLKIYDNTGVYAVLPSVRGYQAVGDFTISSQSDHVIHIEVTDGRPPNSDPFDWGLNCTRTFAYPSLSNGNDGGVDHAEPQ